MLQLFEAVHLFPLVIERLDFSYGLKPWKLTLLIEILYYKTNLYAKIPLLDKVWGINIGHRKKMKISDFPEF